MRTFNEIQQIERLRATRGELSPQVAAIDRRKAPAFTIRKRLVARVAMIEAQIRFHLSK